MERTRSTLPAAATAVLLAVAAPTAPAAAQELPMAEELPLPGVTGYDGSVPAPDEVIGHLVGTRHTESDRVVDYFRAVAEASDRVTVAEHARSYEDRPLLHAVVTSRENHGRLEQIRRTNRRLSEEPGTVTDEELAGMPTVVYMGYSIHGDEASGTEAAMLLLYHLAAGSGPAVEEVLDRTVVLIDPMFNPDGRDRFVDWVNRNRGAVPVADPRDREHVQPWPGGRTNHYLFDLNRDWLPARHPESRGRLEVFHRWRPQLLTDFHEMGPDATYFFQPGVPSRTNPRTPERNQELTGRIAEYHAERLDSIGQLYYTRESYDDFYYGKGSTYPDVNGAVGILFEQASSRALERETENGLLTYATTVRNQIATSLSTLEAAVAMRPELLEYQRSFYASAPEAAAASPVRAWVVATDEARTRAQEMAELLLQHRVDIYDLERDVSIGERTYRAGEAYVVPVDQPQARLVRAFLERTTSFPDSIFYDVSTWTLPLAFGVRYGTIDRDPEGLLGEPIEEAAPDGGGVEGGEAAYAYLLPWERYYAARALHRFQAAGALPRLVAEPMSVRVDGRTVALEGGAVVIPVEQQGVDAARLHAIAREAAERDHVRIYAVDSGLTSRGPDLGSRGAQVLPRPEVALLTGGAPGRSSGDGAEAYDAGQVWHLLSERFGVGVSLVDLAEVRGASDLACYDVVVMAGGEYAGLDSAAVTDWVEAGGRLVVLADAVDWAVERGLVELERRELPVDSLLAGTAYGDLDRARGALEVGGSILSARLDTTHPVALGLPERLPVFRTHERFYEPSGRPGRDVAVYDEAAPLLSGYLSRPRREQARGAAAVVAEERGRGEVILIMDDPNFRAFWYGTNRLFLNAVFLGGTL